MCEVNELLKEAAYDGVIKCRDCGISLEPDCPKCGECGWENPIVKLGYI